MITRTMTLLAVSCTAVATTAGLLPVQTGATLEPEVAATVIVVNPDRQIGRVSPLTFGVNHRYGYDGFQSYDAATGQIPQKFVDEVRNTKVSALRYPGGTIANLFRWKRAVGPTAERGCQTHGSRGSGEPLSSNFGPDEHARFAGSVGAETTLVVNFATGTPQEAADWVEYMNASVGTNPSGGVAWAKVRADNGHPAPYNVRWWEVGNEMNGPGQAYWMGTGDIAERAQKYAFGGSTAFTSQPVGVGCDQRPSASVSTGDPAQRFEVYYPPVVEDSQTVIVDGTAWTEVASLESVGPDDRVYTFDPATGRITFGDGTHGAVPAQGARVAASYTSGPHAGFVEFAEAMRRVDRRIRVCSAFTDESFLSAMGKGNPLNCLTVHRYANFQDAPTATAAHDTAMMRADDGERIVAAWQRRLDELTGGRAVVALTEYGMFRGGYTGSDHYLRSLDQGLQMASMLGHWIQLGVPLAEKHSLVDFDPDNAPPGSEVLIGPDQSMFGWAPSFVPSASARVLELHTHMIGDTLVDNTVTGNPIRQGAAGDYPALLVTSTTDAQGNLHLVVVNRDPERDITAQVRYPGFRGGDTADVWTVNGPETFSFNSPGDEDVVEITKTQQQVQTDGFDYTFPAHSVTGIQLSARAGTTSVR
jgi:alpha-L-arabinofuranosidase